jgi:hypothetical protein
MKAMPKQKQKNSILDLSSNTTRGSKSKIDLPDAVMGSLDDNLSIGVASSCERSGETSLRRNIAGNINKTDRFSNLEKGVVPFVYGTGKGNYDSNISAKDAVVLCQKAYWNVPIFRNTIDLMTEFSLSDIYLTGGNEQSRKFFNLWLQKINSWDLQDQFYREFYRSGNIFIYKFRADFGRENMMKIQEAFGSKKEKESFPTQQVPVKYIVLNPADINIVTSSSFLDNVYVKILNDYELQSLLNPKTDSDRQIAEKIPEIKKLIDEGKSRASKSIPAGFNNIGLELDKDRLVAVFYKKQNYEPLSVPMGFAVLEDINSKLELKKIDQAIARSVQQAVLMITMGDEKVGMPSAQNLTSMRKLFENQSVGKVLVADYTTNAKFVIPDIGNLLDPKKYQILDNDIRMGLNSILFGEEKFSNTSIKVKVFFARLKYGREKFLRDFLIPEMKEVGKALGFKQVPMPKLEDVDFEDNVLMSRVYSRLIELGVLTPEEGFDVFQSGRLPTSEESVESQKKYKELKDKGYYQPLIGGSKDSEKPNSSGGSKNPAGDVGRPSGTSGIKQSSPRKVSIQVSAEDNKNNNVFSCSKMKNVISSLTALEKNIESTLKKKFKIKKLNEQQLEVLSDIAMLVAQNEKVEDWNCTYQDYINNPSKSNPRIYEQIDHLASVHSLDARSASILFHSKK